MLSTSFVVVHCVCVCGRVVHRLIYWKPWIQSSWRFCWACWIWLMWFSKNRWLTVKSGPLFAQTNLIFANIFAQLYQKYRHKRNEVLNSIPFFSFKHSVTLPLYFSFTVTALRWVFIRQWTRSLCLWFRFFSSLLNADNGTELLPRRSIFFSFPFNNNLFLCLQMKTFFGTWNVSHVSSQRRFG